MKLAISPFSSFYLKRYLCVKHALKFIQNIPSVFQKLLPAFYSLSQIFTVHYCHLFSASNKTRCRSTKRSRSKGYSSPAFRDKQFLVMPKQHIRTHLSMPKERLLSLLVWPKCLIVKKRNHTGWHPIKHRFININATVQKTRPLKKSCYLLGFPIFTLCFKNLYISHTEVLIFLRVQHCLEQYKATFFHV